MDNPQTLRGLARKWRERLESEDSCGAKYTYSPARDQLQCADELDALADAMEARLTLSPDGLVWILGNDRAITEQNVRREIIGSKP